MISPLDSRVLDVNSESLGIEIDELMANAGEALADVITKMFNGKRILFVCGTGNNGGDGYVAARLLDADVAYFKEPKTAPAMNSFMKVENRPMQYSDKLLDDYDVIVDCVLGTGVSGEIREPYASYIKAVNASGKKVVSCDVPSGFGTSEMVRPDVTVTFHDMKEGMNEENCGTIVIADIGIPAEAYEYVGTGDVLRYPVPDVNSHKGQNGRLLIIGGGPYTGAPSMAGMAALRVGTDLVHIATPESSFQAVASASSSYIVHRLKGDHLDIGSMDYLIDMSKDMDAVLIGPGLGTDEETRKAIVEFIERCDRPMVVDADGVTSFRGDIPKKNIVFTPHRGEFEKLARGADPKVFAEKNQCVVVLKGHIDTITDGKKTRKNSAGTSAMTVGGTGDVLAGTIAGLLAKGMSPFDAGCLGAYLCGKAGEMAFKEFSYGLLATDIIDDIARVLSEEL